MEVVRGEGENDEIGEGAAYNKTDEEENNFDESVTCVCGKGRERNEWRRGGKERQGIGKGGLFLCYDCP